YSVKRKTDEVIPFDKPVWRRHAHPELWACHPAKRSSRQFVVVTVDKVGDGAGVGEGLFPSLSSKAVANAGLRLLPERIGLGEFGATVIGQRDLPHSSILAGSDLDKAVA